MGYLFNEIKFDKADESFAEKPALKKAQYQFLSSTITTSADDQTKDNESMHIHAQSF